MRAQMGSRQHQISLRWNRIRLMDLLENIGTRARQFGLNLIAAIPAERYDRVAGPAYRAQTIEPACRSIVIIGNGGGDFWRCFKAHTADRPGWLARDNPLDDFTREIIEMHGGQVGIASSIGEGTTVWFTVPIAGEPELGGGT